MHHPIAFQKVWLIYTLTNCIWKGPLFFIALWRVGIMVSVSNHSQVSHSCLLISLSELIIIWNTLVLVSICFFSVSFLQSHDIKDLYSFNCALFSSLAQRLARNYDDFVELMNEQLLHLILEEEGGSSIYDDFCCLSFISICSLKMNTMFPRKSVHFK